MNWYKNIKLGYKRKGIEEKDKNEILNKYKQGLSIRSLSKMYSIPTYKIKDLLESYGIKIRTRSEHTRMEWMDPEIRKRKSDKMREVGATPERKEFLSQKAKQWWKDVGGFWSFLSTKSLEERYNIINNMVMKMERTQGLNKDRAMGIRRSMMEKARALDVNPENPHLTETVHNPYATGDEPEPII